MKRGEVGLATEAGLGPTEPRLVGRELDLSLSEPDQRHALTNLDCVSAVFIPPLKRLDL